nr:MAG TPA: hypothetical protein [Caudoviricetes sp.]
MLMGLGPGLGWVCCDARLKIGYGFGSGMR